MEVGFIRSYNYYFKNKTYENKIYMACEKSIKVLDELDEKYKDDKEILDKLKNGKHPYVSAIILDKNGNILKDDRGELIELTDPKTGKHAEAKVIERLLLAKDNVIKRVHTLITILEPCSYRNTRKYPEEIACAKLITYAGIKQVIVGMLDPALPIRGHGLNILRQWNVYFTMFPFSLVKKIKKKNKKYPKNEIKPPRITDPEFNPLAEVELIYAPRSIQNFMNREDIQSHLKELIKQFFNKYHKSSIYIRTSKPLSKFAKKQYESGNASIKKVLNLAKRTKVGNNFTIYEKIAQYFGYPITQKDENRDVFILFNMLKWYYENYFI